MKKIIALALILVTSTVAFGSTVGNGGTGVVCYDKNNKIKSAEILDFWEARILDRYTFKPTNKDFYALAKDYVLKVEDELLLPGFEMSEFFNTYFISRMQFLPQGVRLNLTGDVNTVLAPPQGCEYAQIINFTNDDRILVVSDIWDKLDNVNKAALLTHEMLYWGLRQNQSRETDSVRTRKTVAALFAGFRVKPRYYTNQESNIECKNDDLSTYFRIYRTQGATHAEFYLLNGFYSIGRVVSGLTATSPGTSTEYSPTLGEIEKIQLKLSGEAISSLSSNLKFFIVPDQSSYHIYFQGNSLTKAFDTKVSCSLNK